jgi:dipeptidyl aminopeptidase/acylaminoacyl peptidase
VTGDAFPIAEEVSFNANNGRLGVSVATNGTLVHTTAAPEFGRSQLNWYDRSGKPLGRVGNVESYGPVRLSPDERQVAYARRDLGTNGDIWILDLLSGVASRFTVDPADESDPVWSPDGKQLAFHSTRKGKRDLYIKAVGGTSEDLVLDSDEQKMPEHWLSDGRLAFRTGLGPGSTIHVLSLTGERKRTKLFETPFVKDEVHVSPDASWVAFNADDSGQHEVYVASFPDFTNLKQVSNAGGGQAFWRKDGRELFYLSLDGKLMAVEISTTNGLQTGMPKVLFQTRVQVNLQIDQYGPTADGQKFLLVEPTETSGPRSAPLTVVLDWTAGLPVVD